MMSLLGQPYILKEIFRKIFDRICYNYRKFEIELLGKVMCRSYE